MVTRATGSRNGRTDRCRNLSVLALAWLHERGTPLAVTGFSAKNAVRAKALNVAAMLASLQDDNNTARTLVEESLELSRELAERKQTGYALYILGRLARIEGNYAGAVTFLEESLSLF